METANIKDAFSKFKPETCVFVISVDKQGNPNGMVAGWNMKCSLQPPLFAVALSKKGNTQRLIHESKEFVVAVPNKSLEEQVCFFGSVPGNDVDKFAESKIATTPAKHVKSPLLQDATINFECALENMVEVGDHYLFIGRILAAHITKGKKVLLNMGKSDGERVFEEF
jgi:flavin reductase (DIM6/NTAB) family NADH-FMN oxidoreductase RutF